MGKLLVSLQKSNTGARHIGDWLIQGQPILKVCSGGEDSVMLPGLIWVTGPSSVPSCTVMASDGNS